MIASLTLFFYQLKPEKFTEPNLWIEPGTIQLLEEGADCGEKFFNFQFDDSAEKSVGDAVDGQVAGQCENGDNAANRFHHLTMEMQNNNYLLLNALSTDFITFQRKCKKYFYYCYCQGNGNFFFYLLLNYLFANFITFQ